MSANTRSRIRRRSSSPAAVSIAAPNATAISASAGWPGCTSSRATTSASKIGTPRWRNASATVLFPDAIPPVRATQKLIADRWPLADSRKPERLAIHGHDLVAEYELNPPRRCDERAERNRCGSIVTANHEECAADERTNQR